MKRETVKDIVGTEVEVGDVVAYPVQTTKGLAMSVGTVVDVVSAGCLKLRTVRRDGQPYNFNFTRIDRVVVTHARG